MIVTFEDGTSGQGTAFMVSDNIAVTAGHCVVNAFSPTDTITLFPGKDGDSNPFGSTMARSYTCPQALKDNPSNGDYDWAILVLNSNIGNNTGWMGLKKFGNYSDLIGQYATIYGYPGKYQYRSSGFIQNATDTIIEYPIDMTAGQSGSPVYNLESGIRHAVGVNTKEYKYIPLNLGSRVNQFLFDTAVDIMNNN